MNIVGLILTNALANLLLTLGELLINAGEWVKTTARKLWGHEDD